MHIPSHRAWGRVLAGRSRRGAEPPEPAGDLRPRDATGSTASAVLTAAPTATRTTAPPGRRPSRNGRPVLSRFDQLLALTATAVSVLALVVLAGLPSPGSGAGAAARGVVLLLFWLAGPGVAVVLHLRLPPSVKLSQAPLLGLALLIGTSLLGAWTGVWVPRSSAAVLAVATGVAAGVPLVRRSAPGSLDPSNIRLPLPRPRPSSLVLVAALLLSVLAWSLAIPGIRSAEPSVFGLLVHGPRLFPVALAGVLAVGLVALRGRRPRTAGAAVAALVIVLRTTAAVVSSAPGPAWAYKHIGVVETLLQRHHVVSGTDIYMNWPGMFSAAAHLSDASGVGSLELARWITPVVHLLLALEVAALARVLGSSTTGAAGASLLVVLVNWVGQDYFAPQAVALCLAGGVLVALAVSRASRTSAVCAVVLFAAIVPTHQLTPFWLLGLAVALTVFRQVPWWVPLLMAALVAAFVVPRLDVVAAYGIFSGFDPVANATNNVPGVTAVGSQVGSLVARATVVVMWLSTAFVLLRRLVRTDWRRPWRNGGVVLAAAMAFSPLALLGGQSYGGEAINRVILYSCLGCSAVLGPALVGALQRRLLIALGAVVWTVVLGALTVQASYSQWFMNVVRPEDVAAARLLAAQAPDANVVPVVFNWPGRVWLDYERYYVTHPEQDASLDGILYLSAAGAAPPNGQPVTVAQLEELVQGRPTAGAFVVFTASMRARDAYYATYAPGTYQALLDGLQGSRDWRLTQHSGDLWVFQYVAPGFPGA